MNPKQSDGRHQRSSNTPPHAMHGRKKVRKNSAPIEPTERRKLKIYANTNKFSKRREKFGVEMSIWRGKKSRAHARISQMKNKLLNLSDIIYQIFNFGISKVSCAPFYVFLFGRRCCCCCSAPVSNYCIGKIFGIKHATLNKLNFLPFRRFLSLPFSDRMTDGKVIENI